MHIDIYKCADILQKNDNILLLTHIRPDGDTIGSAAALCLALRNMGKTAYLHPSQFTRTYMPFTAPFIAPDDFQQEFTAAIDTAAADMLPTGFSAEVDLCVDHHPSNTGYAKYTHLEQSRSSCGEVVYDLIIALTGGVSAEIADLLYIAVSTDTGCFCYSNTKANSFKTAWKLIEAGADNVRLNKLLFRTVSPARVKLEGFIYSEIKRHNKGEIAIIGIPLDVMNDFGADEADCEDIASLPGRIAGVRVSATLRELTDGGCKVSMRSGAGVDVNAICRKLGGGGHVLAAGCTLHMNLSDALDTVLRAMKEELR